MTAGSAGGVIKRVKTAFDIRQGWFCFWVTFF